MRHLLAKWGVAVLALGLGGLGQAIQAQDIIEVKQIRGQQAIVEFPPGLTPERGQQLVLKSQLEEDAMVEAPLQPVVKVEAADSVDRTGPRNSVIGLGFNFSSLKPKGADEATTNLNLSARYGWNLGLMEMGGLLTFETESGGGDSSSEIGLGGFFDFNFIRNQEPNRLIPGFGLSLAFLQSSPSGQDSLTGFSAHPEFYLKWFMLGTPAALRMGLGYEFRQLGEDSSGEISGLVFNGGFSIYF